MATDGNILTDTTAVYVALTIVGDRTDKIARSAAENVKIAGKRTFDEIFGALKDVNKWFDGTSSAGISGNTSTMLGGLTISENVIVGTGQARTVTLKTGAAAASGYYFDDGTNAQDGGTSYDTTANQLTWRANNANQMNLLDGFLFPALTNDIVLGGSSNGFISFYLHDGVTAPGTPSTGAVLYVDTADGDLKVKFSDGFVGTIAADS